MTTRIFCLNTQRKEAATEDAVTLSLKELMPDEGGDIVVFSGAETDISVVTDDPVTAEGIAEGYVTRAGHNVSGFAYCRFAGGITMYYPRAHLLCVEEDETETQVA
jgi:hypothetical protein